jgi:hypothetical protein
MEQYLYAAAFFAIIFFVIRFMFFKKYPSKHTFFTRFRADLSKGFKGFGDFGSTYSSWEAEEDETHARSKKDKQ